jgi:GTP:adenosylcobinamide-phosphate guanylyltransferase
VVSDGVVSDSRKVNAVILAGRRNTGKLKDVASAEWEALIDLGGRPMLQYMVDACSGSSIIGRTAVVGPAAVLSASVHGRNLSFVEAGDSAIENLRRGLGELGAEGFLAICASDLPLVTAEILDRLIRTCLSSPAQLYYPVIPREDNEAAFPGMKRTYGTMREGTLTGGNVFLVDAAILESKLPIADDFFLARKNPLKMAGLLGWTFLLRLLLRRLSIPDIERRVGALFGLRGKAVICHDPEVAVDVDKPSDLELVRRLLAAGPGGAASGRPASVG